MPGPPRRTSPEFFHDASNSCSRCTLSPPFLQEPAVHGAPEGCRRIRLFPGKNALAPRHRPDQPPIAGVLAGPPHPPASLFCCFLHRSPLSCCCIEPLQAAAASPASSDRAQWVMLALTSHLTTSHFPPTPSRPASFQIRAGPVKPNVSSFQPLSVSGRVTVFSVNKFAN